MKLFLQWIISAIAIGIATYLVPGVSVTIVGALVLAVVLSALNLLIRPILLDRVFTRMPAGILFCQRGVIGSA